MGTGCITSRKYTKVENKDQDSSEYTRIPKKVKRNQIMDENVALKENKDHSQKRRKSVFNPNYQEAEAGRKVENPLKTDEDKAKIITALNNHFIFTSLTDEDKEMVAEAMELYDFPAESVVFLQDMPSKSYYVVKEGTLEVIVNNKRVNKIHAGEGFGELALLQDNPRSATLKSLEPTLLWGVDRNTFRKVIEEMNTAIYEQNRQFLEKVTLLSSLESTDKDILAANLVSYKYHQDQKIITEGETGNQLYIIKEGTVIVMRGTNPIAEMNPGNYFGELALLNNTPRTATCVAKTFVKCMCLSRETLQKVLSNQLQDIIEKNTIMEAINKSETLSILTKEQKSAIVKDLHEKNYKGGDVVVPVGSQCKSKIYIIITGRLQYAKASTLLIDKGNCVGDLYVTKSHAEDLKYEDDLIASCDMKVGEITKYQFEISIKGKYEEVIKENAATNVLKKVNLFSTLDGPKMKELFNMIKVEKYNPDEIILREGAISNSVFVVKRGKVDAFKTGNLSKTITKHNYFGERFVLNKGFSNYTFVANGNVTLWCISNSDFEILKNPDIEEVLKYRCKLEDEEVDLQNLIVIKQLGKGMFAKVFLVKTDKSEYYALKGVSRRKIEKFAINEQLILEKRILNQIDHPFIVKLVKCFNDPKRIYFLLEYIHGLDLSLIMRYVGLLSNTDSQFYIASMILILQYLHERDIIYRDLKPDNIIVDTRGYIKLVDFGTAKVIQTRTYTLVGSPHYVAPEVIVGKGYNKMGDIWSLGICLYEFLCGKVPYGEEESDPYRIYEEILEKNVEFPEGSESIGDATSTFIKQLLNKFPESRCPGSIEKLKKHEWFSGFDWEKLVLKQASPPYKPDIPSINDNDDDFEDLDESQAPWDKQLDEASNNTSDSLPDVLDTEIEEYKKTIPYNWDQQFV